MRSNCDFEPRVLEAIRLQSVDDDVRSHVRSCEICGNGAVVDPWLKDLANQPVRERMLPSSSLLWLKSRIVSACELSQKATRPILYVQRIVYGLVAIGWASLIGWSYPVLTRLVAEDPIPHEAFTQALLGSGGSVYVLWVFAGLSCVTLMLTLHNLFAEQ